MLFLLINLLRVLLVIADLEIMVVWEYGLNIVTYADVREKMSASRLPRQTQIRQRACYEG